MPSYLLSVNGRPRRVEVRADSPLLWVLRDHLDLTGTKFGCGQGTCGACTVHLEGRAVRSCTLSVAEVGTRAVTTIEGLSADGSHPVQRAWVEEDVAQCGYCQPGMIMAAAAARDEAQALADLAHHVCRCGTFCRIRRAVRSAFGGKR